MDVQERLFRDAREELVRPLRDLVGQNDLEEIFVAWLIGSGDDELRIDASLQNALSKSNRIARGVAVLGFAAAAQGLDFKHAEELRAPV